METRANFVLIGAFTLSVIVGVFLLVLWLSGPTPVSQVKTYKVLFTGSVSGLSRGAAVLFNGLRVGDVTHMDFVANDPSHVTALIQVESRVPVRQDTKARLELQGLTGGSVIALTGGAADAPELLGEKGAPPIIVAEPSQIQNLLETVQDLAGKADAVLNKADKLIDENGPAVTDTIKNVDAFSKALGDSSGGLGQAITGIGEIGRKIGPLATKLEELSEHADKLVTAIDPDQVRKVVGDIAAFSDTLAANKGSLQALVTDAAALAKRLNESSGRLDSILANVDAFAKSLDGKKVADVVDGADKLVGAIDPAKVQRVVGDLAEFSDALAGAKGSVQPLLSDAAALAKRLNESTGRLDSILANVDAFAKSLDGKKVADVVDGADKLVGAVDPAKVQRVVSDIAQFSDALADAKDSVKPLLSDAAALAKKLNETSGRLDSVLANIDALVKSVDTKKVANLMEGADALGDALRQNRGNMDRTLKDAAELAAKLNNSADKVDGVLTSLQNFVGSPDVKGALGQVGDAARSFKQLSDDLDLRVKEISAGLIRFSSSGLREYEALAIDGRRAINDLDRVVRSFERNPSQLIFGAKPALPEYHGTP